MVLIRNQFYPGPVLHRHVAAEPLVGTPTRLQLCKALARRIRDACAAAKITQREFARRADISSSYLCSLDARDFSPRPETIARIAAVCASIEERG